MNYDKPVLIKITYSSDPGSDAICIEARNPFAGTENIPPLYLDSSREYKSERVWGPSSSSSGI